MADTGQKSVQTQIIGISFTGVKLWVPLKLENKKPWYSF